MKIILIAAFLFITLIIYACCVASSKAERKFSEIQNNKLKNNNDF